MDLRIAVLALLARLEAIGGESLLRASMDTREADGAVVAGDGCLLISGGRRLKGDIVHRADAGTDAATGALGGIDLRTHAMDHASCDCRTAEKP